MEYSYRDLQALTCRGGTAVRLPSDHLSEQALARRNGPCRTYRLGCPMTGAQFLSMPRDLRRTYLSRLRLRGGSEESVRRMLGLDQKQMKVLLQEAHISLDQPDPASWYAFLAR